MTVPPFLPFSCFQAFFAAPARLPPLSRPSICYKSSSPTCFRLVSILCRILASVPPYFIFCHILTSELPYSIFCRILASVPAYFIFCCILASVPPYSRLLFTTFSASIILSVYIPRAISLSVSPAYTKSIYIITKCYFECRFESNLYSLSAVKYLFFYL